MAKNQAAAALGNLSVKKRPELHTKDRMKELVKIRAEKRAERKKEKEPTVVKSKLNMDYTVD